MRHIPIAGKFLFLIALFAVFAVGIAFYTGAKLRNIDDRYSTLISNDASAAIETTKADRVLQSARSAIGDMLMSRSDELNQSSLASLKSSREEIETIMDNAISLLPEDKELIDLKVSAIRTLDQACGDTVRKGSVATSETDVATSQQEFLKTCQPQFRPLGERFKEKTVSIKNAFDSKNDELTELTNSTIFTTYAIILSGLGLVIVIGMIGVKAWLVRPIRTLEDQMKRLAGGDLSFAITGTERRDELGAMAKAVQIFKDAANQNKRLEAEAATVQQAQAAQRDRQSAIDNAKAEDLRVFVHHVEAGFDALSSGDLTVRMREAVAPEFEPIRAKFNTSVESLESAIGSVVGAVGAMRVGLNEITVAAGDLSQRTEQQAASLEQTVAALAEVTRGINGTASEAIKAQNTASTALENAQKGGSVVADAVEAMSQIEQSSDKIGKIIGVIDEIAFQTNLLALNAGVEAARAGEAGRGFAVVAQEVRGLAQRSAEAAKEIKGLIATSSAQVGQGVELVTASGKSLEEIVSQVAAMSDVVAGIAKSSSEQSQSLKEVSTAADQMDKVTQQNAAMVEETTAAAQNLLGETDDLAGLIQRFRTSQSQTRPSSARTPARTPAAKTHRPVAQMRATGTGSAAPKATPGSEDWAEF